MEYAIPKNRSGRNSCCVPRCVHYLSRPGSEHIHFHRFPQDENLSKEWAQRMKRADYVPSYSSYICSDHFTKNDYEKLTQKGAPLKRPKLKKTACPSRFDCLPESARPPKIIQRSSPKKRPALPPSAPPKRQRQEAQTEVSLQDLFLLEKENSNLKERVKDLDDKLNLATGRIKELETRLKVLQQETENQNGLYERRLLCVLSEKQELEKRLAVQEFRVEKFAESDTSIMKLTGIPCYKVLKFIFEDIMHGDDPDCMAKIDYRNNRKDESYPNRDTHGGRKMALDPFNQFFLMLVKLRTGMTEDILSAIFGVSRTVVSRAYNTWLRVARERFDGFFREWPFIVSEPLPVPSKVQDHYKKISLIVDCFEIKIEKPANPDAAKKCYSNYKHGYTVKVLVGVETDGNVGFLSHPYQGAISDLAIVRESGLFSKLQIGDVVLADRGFQLADQAADLGIRWVVPPSVRREKGIPREDLLAICQIARDRILVERSIGRIKNFHQLDGPIKICDIPKLDDELRVIGHLCRFQPLLVSDLFPNRIDKLFDDSSECPIDVIEREYFSVHDLMENEKIDYHPLVQ